MSSLGKVLTYPNNPRFHRISAVAALGGASVEESVTDMATIKGDERLPIATCPAFESADGAVISETGAIILAVAAAANVLPSSKKDMAELTQWVFIAEGEIAGTIGLATGMINGYVPYTKPSYQFAVDKVMRRLTAIDKYLHTRTYLVGDRLSAADISVAGSIAQCFQSPIDTPLRETIPNVVRYVNTVLNNSKLKSSFGDYTFSDKAPAYVAPKKEGAAAASAKPAAPAAEKAPKAPKASKPKAAAEDDDDDEPMVPEEPKAKNPLDDLPKSEFKLDDWKRTYSNEDTVSGAIPWFYKNFDAEGFSVWKVDYKYNDELTQVFMSSNLIGGFFNRLEGARKYAFGSMGVFGKANDSVISGTLVVRGKDIQPVVEFAPDWESYSYSPLDLSKEEDKKFFEGALAWTLEVDGKPWADGKVYK